MLGFWEEKDEPDEHDKVDGSPDPSDLWAPSEMLGVEEVWEGKGGQPGEKEGD